MHGGLDLHRLHDVVKVAVKNLNRVLDVTVYPTGESVRSSERHRAIGVGVQGLADLFIALQIAFDSKQAKDLNIIIAETIYYAALDASADLAAEEGVYNAYFDSPASNGILQFDLWGVTPSRSYLDWDALKEKIRKTGLRNSLLVAYMPTAGTSQITGCSEGFEPITRYAHVLFDADSRLIIFIHSNIFSRRVLNGETRTFSLPLVKDLTDLGLWSEKMRTSILANRGEMVFFCFCFFAVHQPRFFRISPEHPIYTRSYKSNLQDRLGNQSSYRHRHVCRQRPVHLSESEPFHPYGKRYNPTSGEPPCNSYIDNFY